MTNREQIARELQTSLDIRRHQKYKSEAGQDDWVILKSREKRDGFFVDIGSADACIISNTYRLEKDYGWNGICIEPNDLFTDSYKERNCLFLNMAVSNEVGILKLRRETFASSLLKKEKEYTPGQPTELVDIQCDTLLNILDKHHAPKVIDYINCDTPGSEYDIFSCFDFNKYDVKLITVRNTPSTCKQVEELLVKNGFTREPDIYIDMAYSRI